MQTLLQDVRYAVRLAARRPVLTAVAVATLAIGVGGTTAIFSFVNGLLIRPLPVAEAHRVVRVFGATDERTFDVLSYPNAVDFGARSTTLASLAIHQQTFVATGLGEGTESAALELVSGNYFATLGLPAAVGRVIGPADDVLGAPQQVLVISDRWWSTRFGNARDAIGSTVHINGAAFSVIGVMSPAFRGTYDALGTDFWVPLATYNIVRPRGNDITRRGWGWLSTTGRLKPGVQLSEARAELASIARALEQEYPSPNKGLQVNVVEALAVPEDMAPVLQRVLLFALVVVALALGAACANIANAQLATVIARRREIAVRLAMGATRGRVLRQWLTESALLAIVATMIGLLVAVWTRDALMLLKPPLADLQNLVPDLSLDWRVLLFSAAVAGIVALVFGGLPAFRAARIDVATPLKEDGGATTGGRQRAYAQSLLVIVQIAVSLSLLVSAGLLVRSLDAATAFDIGFNRDNLVIAQPDSSGLNYEPARLRAYYRDTVDRLRALPGVADVSFAAVVPLGGMQESRGLQIEGYTPPNGRAYVSVATNLVSTNYFDFMQIPLVSGRTFTESDSDDQAAPVVVVNETMAARFWSGASAVGRRVRFGPKDPWMEVVGVARDITYYSLGEAPQPYFYVPFGSATMSGLAFQLRAAKADLGLFNALRRELRSSDPRIRVPIAMSYAQLRQLPLYPGRVMATLSSAFGVLALLLTVVGLYGVVTYAVTERTREFAVRMALGARPADILRGVLRRGAVMAVLGVMMGIGVAMALARLLSGFLFGVSAVDPLTFGGWAAVLIAISLAAAYLPARRATKIDPAAALTGRS
jgi:predicted permease